MTVPAAEGSRPPLLVVIEHAVDEGPGLIGEIATGFGMQVRRLGAADPLPGLDGMTALVVMGGPQSVHQPDRRLREEVVLLHEAVTRGLPVLGVCLGAQLAAAACGAPVRPGEQGPELGLGAVTLTAPGQRRPRLRGLRPHPGGAPLARRHLRPAPGLLPSGSQRGLPQPGFPARAGVRVPVPPRGRRRPAGQLGRAPRPARRRAGVAAATDAERRGVIARWVRQALDAVP